MLLQRIQRCFSLSLSLSLSKFEELGFQILIGRLRFILSVSEDVDGTVWPQRWRFNGKKEWRERVWWGRRLKLLYCPWVFHYFLVLVGDVLTVKKNGKRESLVSALHGSFVLLYSHLASPIEGKIFLSHSYPLGPHEVPTHPVKLYFLLICPATITIFF